MPFKVIFVCYDKQKNSKKTSDHNFHSMPIAMYLKD